MKQRWGARLLRWGLLVIALGALGSGLRFYDPATRDLPAAFLLLISTPLFIYSYLMHLAVKRYLRSTRPEHCPRCAYPKVIWRGIEPVFAVPLFIAVAVAAAFGLLAIIHGSGVFGPDPPRIFDPDRWTYRTVSQPQLVMESLSFLLRVHLPLGALLWVIRGHYRCQRCRHAFDSNKTLSYLVLGVGSGVVASLGAGLGLGVATGAAIAILLMKHAQAAGEP